MARLFQERQKAMEQNPLYQLSVRVRNQLQDWIPAKVLECHLCSFPFIWFLRQ